MTDRLTELAYHTGWMTALLTDEELMQSMIHAPGSKLTKDHFDKALEHLRPIIEDFYRR